VPSRLSTFLARRPSNAQLLKLGVGWAISNLLWPVVALASGFLVSGAAKGVGALDNTFGLIGVALAVAALVFWGLRCLASHFRHPESKPGAISSPPRLPLRFEQQAKSTGMTPGRRRTAIKQYEQTRAREAEQREQIKRELREEEVERLAKEAQDRQPARFIERGEALIRQITEAQIEYKRLPIKMAAGIALGDLTARVERWVTESGGGLGVPHPSEDPTDTDYSRLRLFVQDRIAAISKRDTTGTPGGQHGES
jgi:hypothetical protein